MFSVCGFAHSALQSFKCVCVLNSSFTMLGNISSQTIVWFSKPCHKTTHTMSRGKMIKSFRLSPCLSGEDPRYEAIISSCIDIYYWQDSLFDLQFSSYAIILFHSWSSGSILTSDDLHLLLEELVNIHERWYNLGLQLKVMPGTLDRIRTQFPDLRRQLWEMLKAWLTTSDHTSWKALTDAVRSRSVNESRTADYLESKYCPMKEMDESKHHV